MKVLMIVTWYSPRDAETISAGIFHYEQSIALQKYCDVGLFFPFDENENKGLYKENEKGLLTYRVAAKNSSLPLKIKELYNYGKKVIEDFKPDIIHAHVAAMAGTIACLLGKKYNIPVVITEHNPVELSHFESIKNKLQVAYAYKNSRANICVSKDLQEKLQKIFKKSDFKLIHNGIPGKSTFEKSDKSYRVSDSINCSITASLYDKDIKGFQYLIPAIKELLDQGIRITLHICGGGDYLQYYVDMVNKLGIKDNVIFYGQCDKKKVYDIISEMDFCISASLFESGGVSVQEAMLFGKPLVVTKSGGASSIVTENSAILVDTKSKEALVNGIIEMTENLDKFDTEAIAYYAYDNFEIDNVSKKYLEIYKSLVKQ